MRRKTNQSTPLPYPVIMSEETTQKMKKYESIIGNLYATKDIILYLALLILFILLYKGHITLGFYISAALITIMTIFTVIIYALIAREDRVIKEEIEKIKEEIALNNPETKDISAKNPLSLSDSI